MCLFHKWTNWTQPKSTVANYIFMADGGTLEFWYQTRFCIKCMKAQRRAI